LYETCYEYFPYRGIYSLQQQDGLKRDNWRNFLPLNYYTFEGIVTNIKAVNSSGALVLYEDFSPSQFVGVDTLKTDTGGTKITIGDGGLFANNIQSLVNAEDVIEYGASISNRATLNTPYGLFFVSQKAGKVIQYGSEGMNEISKAGMKNWFLQNLPSPLLEAFPNFTEYDNPVAGIGVQAIYDAQYELLYITKKDYKPLDCVGYDVNFGFYDTCYCGDCPPNYTLVDGICERNFDSSVCDDPAYTYNPLTGDCEKITTENAICPPPPPPVSSILNWKYQKSSPAEGLLTIELNSINVLGQEENGNGSITPCNVGDVLFVEAIPISPTNITVELTISNLSGIVFYETQSGGVSITAPLITILPGQAPYLVDVKFYVSLI
jgi:hypothetical protein